MALPPDKYWTYYRDHIISRLNASNGLPHIGRLAKCLFEISRHRISNTCNNWADTNDNFWPVTFYNTANRLPKL